VDGHLSAWSSQSFTNLVSCYAVGKCMGMFVLFFLLSIGDNGRRFALQEE